VVTKNPRSNVTRLNASHHAHTTIANKAAKEYEPRSAGFYIRDNKLSGLWVRVGPRGRKVYGTRFASEIALR